MNRFKKAFTFIAIIILFCVCTFQIINVLNACSVFVLFYKFNQIKVLNKDVILTNLNFISRFNYDYLFVQSFILIINTIYTIILFVIFNFWNNKKKYRNNYKNINTSKNIDIKELTNILNISKNIETNIEELTNNMKINIKEQCDNWTSNRLASNIHTIEFILMSLMYVELSDGRNHREKDITCNIEEMRQLYSPFLRDRINDIDDLKIDIKDSNIYLEKTMFDQLMGDLSLCVIIAETMPEYMVTEGQSIMMAMKRINNELNRLAEENVRHI